VLCGGRSRCCVPRQGPCQGENVAAPALAAAAEEEPSDSAGKQVEQLAGGSQDRQLGSSVLSWGRVRGLDPALCGQGPSCSTAQGSQPDSAACSGAAVASCARPGDREGTNK